MTTKFIKERDEIVKVFSDYLFIDLLSENNMTLGKFSNNGKLLFFEVIFRAQIFPHELRLITENTGAELDDITYRVEQAKGTPRPHPKITLIATFKQILI